MAVTETISSMPGISRLNLNSAVSLVKDAKKLGISAVALFPKISPNLKDNTGKESYNPNSMICRLIKAIKNSVPDIGVISDIALDPYTSHGHDGILKDGYILNDETIDVLMKQALTYVIAGCDILAPSDMMDGRVLKIRNMLESEGFFNAKIMSYSAKYASCFYGPFRDAVGSKTNLFSDDALIRPLDKKTYQMDYRNSKEAIREVELDIAEGADMVIIKPGMPYLDIIKTVSSKFNIPVLAYQVSGEYSMLKIASQSGIFDEKDVWLESMMAFRRAGAQAIITYAAIEIAKMLNT